MHSVKTNYVREKRFRPVTETPRKRGSHHTGATITDDHTLFLLHQQRDRLSKRDRRSLWQRLLFWRG